MKRLLLPLLAALALPIQAGDLGPADNIPLETRFDVNSESKGSKNKKMIERSKQNKFKTRCGQNSFSNKKWPKYKTCYLEFKNGRLTIDNSEGIKPSQVLHLYGMNPVVFIYRTNENKVAEASFWPAYDRIKLDDFQSFYYRFFDWLGSEYSDN